MGAGDPEGATSLGAAFDGDRYSAATAHHRARDAETLDGLDLGPGACVLDVGCGVGDLTLALWEAVAPGGTVTGLDVSASMLARAAAAAGERPGLSWVHAPAQEVASAVEPVSQDAVVSVAALHWVPGGDQQRVLDDADGVDAWLVSQVLPAYRRSIPGDAWEPFAVQASARVRAVMPDHVAAYVRLQLRATRPG